MRLFIAVTFDEKTKRRIETVQDQLRKEAARGKFTLPENLHLTLVFLGETAEKLLPEIMDAMKKAVSPDGIPYTAFDLVFSKTGFFKRSGKELWWLGTGEENRAGEKRLKELQAGLSRELTARNFSIDKRPFTAHITLGREIINGPWPFETEKITVSINRLSLMLSEHKPAQGRKNRLVYTEIFGLNL